MEQLPHYCIYCDRVAKGPDGISHIGCRHLGDANGDLVLERVITENNFRHCPHWSSIGPRQVITRNRLLETGGLSGVMRALYSLPDLVMDGIRQGEKDELMHEEIPDFDGMLFEGMTSDERRIQLEFETNEQGQALTVIDKEGVEHKKRRPSFQLRAYLSPKSKVARKGLSLPEEMCLSWNSDELINHILSFEVGQGLIVKSKRTRGKSEPEVTTHTTTPQRETQMAPVGSRVRVKTTKSASGLAGPGKAGPGGKIRVAGARAGVRVTGKAAAAPAPEPEAPAKAGPGKSGAGGRMGRPPRKAGAPAVVAGDAPQASKAAVAGGDLVSTKLLQEVLAEIRGLRVALQAHDKKIEESLTTFYDMACGTAGTFVYPARDENGEAMGGFLRLAVDPDNNRVTYVEDAPDDESRNGSFVTNHLPKLFKKDLKLLSYIDDSAWDEDEAVEEEVVEVAEDSDEGEFVEE